MAGPYVAEVDVTGAGYPSAADAQIVAEAATIFYDDFSGVDAQLNGRAPIVGTYPWAATGAAFAADPTKVRAGAGEYYVLGAVFPAYGVCRTAAAIGEIIADYKYSSGTGSPTIAIIKDYPGHGFAAMVHLNVSSATGVFTPGYWNDVWNGGAGPVTNAQFAYVASKSFTSPAPGTEVRERINFNGVDTIVWTVENKATGEILGSCIIVDPILASLVGPYFFLEVGDAATKWTSVRIRGVTIDPSRSKVKALRGITGPIGNDVRLSGLFNSVFVGTGTPKGVFGARYSGTLSDAPGIYSSAGSAEFVIKPEVSGNIGRLLVYNGAGGVAKFEMDGSYALNLIGNSGTAFLTKPANAAAPYFAGTFGIGGASGPTFNTGSASPEGSVTAPVGSLYMRTGGGAATSFYVKETGAGNTGWVAK